MTVVVLAVPRMASRHDVRVVSARLSDLAGVAVIEVDAEARTIRITGEITLAAARAAIVAAGYEVTP